VVVAVCHPNEASNDMKHPSSDGRMVRSGDPGSPPAWRWVGAALAAGLAGCSLIVSVDDECSVDADCGESSVCTDNLCILLSCTEDEDCPAGRGVCEDDRCQVLGCTQDEDCPLGRGICEANVCATPSCTRDEDCGTGRGICIDSQCTLRPVVSLAGDLNGTIEWTADNDYLLEGSVVVEPNSILTIEAGTRIYGANQAALIVLRGAQLFAIGTRDAPIVFTSAQARGTRAPGDWAGVALLGSSPLNTPDGTASLEGLIDERAEYGFSEEFQDQPNCGRMEYVRVEFAGFALLEGDELNGITVAGCGRLTTLDYVQVHKGLDDGIEFFGGEANLRHAVITQSNDDALDWDFGWRGAAQFVVIQMRPDSDDRGIEADNNGGDVDAAPRSSPQIYNLTIVADPTSSTQLAQAALFREGTAATIANAVFTGHARGGLFFSGRSTQECLAVTTTSTVATCTTVDGTAMSTALDIRSAAFQGLGGPALVAEDADPEEFPPEEIRFEGITEAIGEVLADADRNLLVIEAATQQLQDATNLTAPNFQPAIQAGILTLPAVTPPEGPEGFLDTSAEFIGAVPLGNDWTEGWTAYPEN
jgi:hypothetical protein